MAYILRIARDMRKIIFFLILLFPVSGVRAGQHPDAELWWSASDSTRMSYNEAGWLCIDQRTLGEWFDDQPSFGLYKDNYFLTGIPLDRPVNKHTADAKFQISIRQRLTKSILPFKTYLLLTYTQKSFWDVYVHSSPFADLDFNPGVHIGRAVFKQARLRGVVTVGFEHESNGRDSLFSRSWNYFILNGSWYPTRTLTLQAKLWPGWAGDDNPDIYRYRGNGLVAVSYRTLSSRWWFSAVVNPRHYMTAFNTTLEANFRVPKKANQYLFIQWYQGYGESLMEYDKYTSMVRAGICIKPPMRNLY